MNPKSATLTADKRQVFIFFFLYCQSLVISLGSVGLGTFVGFLITVILGIMYPGVGHILGGLLGGLIAGLIARGMFGGSIAGFAAGVLSAVALAFIALIGFAWYGGANYGVLGAFLGGIVGTALSIIISVVAVIASTIGGFFGGLVTR